MANQKQLAKAARLFKNHKDTPDEVHFTSDGQAFFDKGIAESHGKGLKNKELTTVTEAEAKKYAAENPEEETSQHQKNKQAKADKTKAQTGSAAGDGSSTEKPFTEMDIKELKAACDSRKIEYKSNAKISDLVKLLTEYKPEGEGSSSNPK